MTEEQKRRISELTQLARERLLCPEETAERAALRQEYLAEWRRGAEQVFENTVVQRPDGSLEKLRKKKKT